MRFFRLRKDATERGHTHYIRLKLHDVSQLFNSMDPSPFIEKDLDADAEEFIVSWAQEFPRDDPVRLHIYLEQWPAEDPKEPDRKSTRLNSSHVAISYAVFCLKKKKKKNKTRDTKRKR